jgi:energy-coupling factor transport system ATP-binding protein
MIVNMSVKMAIGRTNLRPAISAALTTTVSGFIFITITKVVLSLPMAVYLYGMMPVVFASAAANTVVTHLLYFPAQKLFSGKGEQ